MRFAKYIGKGETGLSNVGNTCYVNSCIQCLSHTYELTELLDDATVLNRIKDIPESILLLEWNKLRNLMWSQNCSIAPFGFLHAIQRVASIKKQHLFSGYQQNDLQEFLLFLMDCFHASFSREIIMKCDTNRKDEISKQCYDMIEKMYSKDYSEIVHLFYGIYVSKISSMDTNEQLSIHPEPFFILSLTIPNATNVITLYDCMNAFCHYETISGENAWYNETLNIKQNVNKEITFWSFPTILIVHLKRWDYRGRKNNAFVDIPFTLDLSKYVKNASYVYDLYGVCDHNGNVSGGHYTANVCLANGGWYNFNDDSVTKMEEKNVISSKAYCLFFRKKIEG
jgi:ubiquitin carboxyl-terminal hydrolase 8